MDVTDKIKWMIGNYVVALAEKDAMIEAQEAKIKQYEEELARFKAKP